MESMGNSTSSSSATCKSPRRVADVKSKERPDAANRDSSHQVEDDTCDERPDAETPDFDASLHCNNCRNFKSSGRTRSKKLSIRISSSASTSKTKHDTADATGGTKVTAASEFGTGALDERKDGELDFLSGDLAPGQDPHYVEFYSTRMENRCRRQLEDTKRERAMDLKQIESHIENKWKERNQELQSQITQLRQDMVAKQTRQRLQLQEKHKQVLEGDRVRIEEAERLLKQKQSSELETKMNRHRQDSIQRGLPNNGMVEWQSIATDLQRKHTSQRRQFEEKKISQRNRTEQDMQTQSRILDSHHKRRTAETESNILQMLNSSRENHDAMKAQLLDLHRQRFQEREDSIKSAFGVDEKRPVRSNDVAVVPRQKISCDETDSTVQLVVELQNEGIIIIARNKEELDKSKPLVVASPRFIPYGAQTQRFLYSIYLGLIPRGFFTENEITSNRVNCLMTDLRTCETRAVASRAQIYADEESKRSRLGQTQDKLRIQQQLEMEVAQLKARKDWASKAHEQQVAQLKQTKYIVNKVKAKARILLQSASANSEAKQRLGQALKKGKEQHEKCLADKVSLSNSLDQLKAAIESKTRELEKTKSEVESSGPDDDLCTRVKILTGVIGKAAERRRAQNASHANSRRVVMTTLRPSYRGVIRQKVPPLSPSEDLFDGNGRGVDKNLQREQELLLALNRVRAPANASDIDRTREENLDLSVPENGVHFLPVNPFNEGLRSYPSGLQSAALMKKRQLRMLENPLSVMNRVDESCTPVELTEELIDSDPLSFRVRPPRKKMRAEASTEREEERCISEQQLISSKQG